MKPKISVYDIYFVLVMTAYILWKIFIQIQKV